MQNDEHIMTWARSQENPMPLILKLLLVLTILGQWKRLFLEDISDYFLKKDLFLN